MNITRLGIVFAAAAAAVSAVAAASKPIDLAYKLPKKTPVVRPALPESLTAAPVRLELSDARGADDPAVVGAQRQKGTDLYLWRAQQPVVPAVAGFVEQILKGWSVAVAPTADTRLAIKLTRYYVNEKSEMFGSSYRAEVRLTAALEDGAGAVLWTREAGGSAERDGPDARSATCNELLSLALRDALIEALGSTPVAGSAPVAPVAAVAPAAAAAAPTVVDPAALFADLTRLKAGGVEDDVLVAYVKQRKLSRPLTVDEILAWKNAGVPDAAIKAAVAQP
jgi:hypothetical protein